MASMSTSTSEPTKEGSEKRLSELLQEQQEPFKLEVYLHERGYKRKSLGFECNSFNCLFNGNKLSEGSAKNFGLNGMRAKRSSSSAVKICSRIAKDLCKKLVCINEILKLKDWNFSGGELGVSVKGRRRKNGKEATAMEESGRLSSGSFSTELSSYSESDIEDGQSNHQNEDDAEERMVQWRMIEENKQCSPVSVLDEFEMVSNVTSGGQEIEEHISRLSFSFPNMKKVTEECIFSASLWELFIHKGRNKRNVDGTSKSGCSRHVNSKKTLQETRQLLFDCVREAVESQGRQKKSGNLIGSEELGKIICANIKLWDKQSVNGKKINKLIRSDILSSKEEQENLEGFREEIVKEVGDMILEEIKDEMADQVVDLYFCKTKDFSC